MKRFLSLLLVAMLALVFSGCGTRSNNGFMQTMGARPELNKDLCDQERADVCKQFPEFEAAFGIAKSYFVLQVYQGKMTKQEVLDLNDKAIAETMTRGVSSGQILNTIFNDPKDVMLLTALSGQLGFNVDYAFNSDYMLDSESKALIVDRLIEMRGYFERVLVEDVD